MVANSTKFVAVYAGRAMTQLHSILFKFLFPLFLCIKQKLPTSVIGNWNFLKKQY